MSTLSCHGQRGETAMSVTVAARDERPSDRNEAKTKDFFMTGSLLR